ncbi:MAG: hypothetical protein R2713_15030 [Ilumatobacteraceae bacterium]
MLTTVIVTVTTHNLAYGVILGVIVAMVFFARRVAHFTEVVVVDHPDEDTACTPCGVLFLASSNDLYTQFDYVNDPQHVIIDLSRPRSTTRPPSPARRDRAEVPPQGQSTWRSSG